MGAFVNSQIRTFFPPVGDETHGIGESPFGLTSLDSKGFLS